MEIKPHPSTILILIEETKGKGAVEIQDNFLGKTETYNAKDRGAIHADLTRRLNMLSNLCFVSHELVLYIKNQQE